MVGYDHGQDKATWQKSLTLFGQRGDAATQGFRAGAVTEDGPGRKLGLSTGARFTGGQLSKG